MPEHKVIVGDCLEEMCKMPDGCVDSVVTDPPAGISFMGKEWDSNKGGRDKWIAWLAEVMSEALRVLKPGGHALVWALPRTSHWTAMAVEDAGFEVRDKIYYHYGVGFPKNLDVGKAIDKMKDSGREERLRVTSWIRNRCKELGLKAADLNRAAEVKAMGRRWTSVGKLPAIPTLEQWKKIEPLLGPPPEWMVPFLKPKDQKGDGWEQREVIGKVKKLGYVQMGSEQGDQTRDVTEFNKRSDEPVTDAAKEWDGWGTALKPCTEEWVLCRKPLEGTVAENVIKYGVGAINIDACRVPVNGEKLGGGMVSKGRPKWCEGWDRPWMHDKDVTEKKKAENADKVKKAEELGRWPAQMIHDGSEEVVSQFPQSTAMADGGKKERGSDVTPEYWGQDGGGFRGGRSTVAHGDSGSAARFFYCTKVGKKERNAGLPAGMKNTHATVKPVALMRYLVRLITPPGGTILDPFVGSGSTMVAAEKEGFSSIGIEQNKFNAMIARNRIDFATGQGRLIL